MTQPRALALGLGSLLVGCAYALERRWISPPGPLAPVVAAEPTHLVMHTALYAALAALLASWWFPGALDDDRMSLWRKAIGASTCFVCAALAQELAQVIPRGGSVSVEELFDLGVDLTGATLGVIAWSRGDEARGVRVARALGLVLHPAFVGPVGVFALAWSAQRELRGSALWTAVATLLALPLAALWIHGVRSGRYGDRDLSRREERSGFLALACVCALSLAAVVFALDAPPAVRTLGAVGALATLLLTLTTRLGLKISGHVALPVGIAVLLATRMPRAVWPFAVTAVALSWARVREGRHSVPEVLGAWSVAVMSAASLG